MFCLAGIPMTPDWGRGWLKFNRIVLISKIDGIGPAEANAILRDIKGTTTVVKKPRLAERWGFENARRFKREYRDALPNSIWGVWTRRRYINKDRNRPERRRVDVTWTLPGLLLIRGERVEADLVYEKLRHAICSSYSDVTMETVSFDSLWFLRLFEVGGMSMSSSVKLESVTGMHFLQDLEWSDHVGNEGKDLLERDASDISRSMFSAVAILFGHRVEGFDGEFEIRLVRDDTTVEATLGCGRDDRVKPRGCEISHKVGYRGSFRVNGSLVDNEDVDELLMARCAVLGAGLVEAYIEWRGKDAIKRVPSDALVNKLKDTINTAMLDIDNSYDRLRRWLENQRNI